MRTAHITLQLLRSGAKIILATAILAFNTGAVFTPIRQSMSDPCWDHQCACTQGGEVETCCCGLTLPRDIAGPLLTEQCLPGSPSYTLFAKPGLQPTLYQVDRPTSQASAAPRPRADQGDCAGYGKLPDKIPILHT